MLTLNTKVVLFGVLNAVLMSAGVFFQKLNGTRQGNVFMSGWLVLSTLCYLPTFFLGNHVFQIGGRLSVFIPITALMYVFTVALGRFYFHEHVNAAQVVGCVAVMAGVGLIARG